MRILIIATFIIFIANVFAQADFSSPDVSEKVIFCKSDSEFLGLVNVYKRKEAPAVLAEMKEFNKRRVYILSAKDDGANVIVRGEYELTHPSADFDYKESDKKFTAVVSKKTLAEYPKKPFVVSVNYDSGQQIEIYCEVAFKPKN